jgi:heme/copper-type cytochrome/quinol oxidase subunit 1
MKIIYKAYLLLMIALLATTFISRGMTIDIHFHDTKFLIAHFYISLFFLLYTLLLTIANYWISKYRNNVSFFQWIVFITSVMVFFWILYASFLQSNRFPGGTIDISTWHNFNQFQKINEVTSILSLFFVLTQLAFWIYFLAFLVRRFIFQQIGTGSFL